MRHLSWSLVVLALGLAACAKVKPGVAVPKSVPTTVSKKPTQENQATNTFNVIIGAEAEASLKAAGLDSKKLCVQIVNYFDYDEFGAEVSLGDFLEFSNTVCPASGLVDSKQVVWTLQIDAKGDSKDTLYGDSAWGMLPAGHITEAGNIITLKGLCSNKVAGEECDIKAKDGKLSSIDFY